MKLKHKSIITMFIVYMLIGLLLFSCQEPEEVIIFEHSNNIEWTSEEELLLDIINNYRLDYNLTSLIPDDTHYKLALQRNNDNISFGDITHKDFPVVFKHLIDNGQS